MDNNKTSWWQKHRPTTRRLIQVYSALLHNAYVKGFFPVRFIKEKVDADRCIHCNACIRACEMDVCRVGDHECIHCGRCAAACSTGAIVMSAGKITLKGPETGGTGIGMKGERKPRDLGRTIRSIALAALCLALLWLNVIEPAQQDGDSGSEQLSATTVPAADGKDSGSESEQLPATGVPTAVANDSRGKNIHRNR